MEKRALTVGFALISLAILSTSLRSVGAQDDLPGQGQATLLLRSLQVPAGGRVESFELHLSGAEIASVSHVPAGWSVVINNDPSSWKSDLVAHANARALSISEAEVEATKYTIAEQPSGASTVEVKGAYVAALAGGQDKPIPLGTYNFDVFEPYRRRLLR